MHRLSLFVHHRPHRRRQAIDTEFECHPKERPFWTLRLFAPFASRWILSAITQKWGCSLTKSWWKWIGRNIDRGNDGRDRWSSKNVLGEPLLIVFGSNIILNLRTTTSISVNDSMWNSMRLSTAYHLVVDHIHSFLFILHILKCLLRCFPAIQLFTEPKHRELCPIHIALSPIKWSWISVPNTKQMNIHQTQHRRDLLFHSTDPR